MEESLQYVKVFKALGDPKRAMILDMLACGELCACMILGRFAMSQSTLSHHMKLLCGSGLVRGRREGKWMYYSLDIKTINLAKEYLGAIASHKASCVCEETVGQCKE